MKRLVASALWTIICASIAFAQTAETQLNRDPYKVKFVTSDIDNFWRAFDLAAKEPDRNRKVAIFQAEYLDRASLGLQDFFRMRIKSAEELVTAVEKLQGFYASVRPSTLRVAEMEKRTRRCFHNFKKIYPDAVFPDVYFVIGVANTGGTTSKNGLIIGTELYGLTKDTRRDEFPDYLKSIFPAAGRDEKQLRLMADRFLDTALRPVRDVPAIIAHESVHFNQRYTEPRTLLEQSIKEGAADFIGKMISGEFMNPARHLYGDQHEAALWPEFEAEMNGTNMKSWLYNAMTSKDRPFDLGYYMGYKICESYYKHAKDKRQAILDILEIKDFRAFLKKSRYREKFAR